MNIIQGYGRDKCIKQFEKDIIELHNDIFPHQAINRLDDSNFWIVITWYNKPIAQTMVTTIKEHCYIQGFGVRKLRRLEGWGRQLFTLVKKFIGTKSLIFDIDSKNIDAVIFFIKMGCQQSEENSHMYYVPN